MRRTLALSLLLGALTMDAQTAEPVKTVKVTVTLYNPDGTVKHTGEKEYPVKSRPAFTSTVKLEKFDPKTGKPEAMFEGVPAVSLDGAQWAIPRGAIEPHRLRAGDRLTAADGKSYTLTADASHDSNTPLATFKVKSVSKK